MGKSPHFTTIVTPYYSGIGIFHNADRETIKKWNISRPISHPIEGVSPSRFWGNKEE